MNIITTVEKKSDWAEIKAAVENGTVKDLVKSRDMIPVALKNGEKIVFDATYDEAGKLYFVMHDCMNDTHAMNNDWTNEGRWRACDMRRYINEEVFPLFPDDLQSVIADTHITQICRGEKVECKDKLFLLSATQVLGKGPWSDDEPDDSPLDIFQTERDRVKNRADYGTEWWWLRRASSYGGFYYIGNTGYSDTDIAGSSGGVALGFCI